MSGQVGMTRSLVIGISGASGAPYARRLLQVLTAPGAYPDLKVELVTSRSAAEVWKQECTGSIEDFGLKTYSGRDYSAPFASGSAVYDAMVVVPCSMSTVARIAQGISDDLLTRAADVVLKERRRLVLVPRETPYSELHLRNMLELTRLGATIMAASPSFYGRPKNLEQVLDTVVGRLLDHLGLPSRLGPRWSAEMAAVSAEDALAGPDAGPQDEE